MSILSKIFGSKKNKNSKEKNFSGKSSDISITNTKSNNQLNPEIPELQGDYAKAIFINAYKDASKIKKDDDYQRYLLYECGIEKPSNYHRNLIKQGYLEDASLEDKIKKLKVTELKNILSEHSLKVSGKKADLIKRVFEIEDKDTLIKYVPDKEYSISEKGKDFLSENIDYIKIHKHKNWQIDWYDYDKRKKKGNSFYEIVLNIFSERISTSHNFGRSEYYSMHELFLEVGKREEALEKLLMVLYNDLSGVDGIEQYKMYKRGIYSKKDILEYFDINIFIAPAIVTAIKKHADIYSEEIINHIYEVYKLPINICNKSLFIEIVSSITNNTFDESEVLKELKREYEAYIDTIR